MIDAFRKDVAHAAPELAPAVEALEDWDQVKLLSVSLDRLTCWWRPGLLAIGDAAHAMSPVAALESILAVQDAVAAANILAAPLAGGLKMSTRCSGRFSSVDYFRRASSNRCKRRSTSAC